MDAINKLNNIFNSFERTKTLKAVKFVEVEQLFNVLMSSTYTYRGKEYNPKELGCTWGWNMRRRAFGVCKRNRLDIYRIELSRWLLDNTKRDIDNWKDTILHEIAHLIDFIIRGKSNHDSHWRSIALAVGADGERCHKADFQDNVQSKYTVYCESCGYERPGHKKRKVIDQGRASCPKCSNVFDKRYLLKQKQNY